MPSPPTPFPACGRYVSQSDHSPLTDKRKHNDGKVDHPTRTVRHHPGTCDVRTIRHGTVTTLCAHQLFRTRTAVASDRKGSRFRSAATGPSKPLRLPLSIWARLIVIRSNVLRIKRTAPIVGRSPLSGDRDTSTSPSAILVNDGNFRNYRTIPR